MSRLNAYEKYFGVGPFGALISFLLLALAWLVDWRIGYPKIMHNPLPLRYIALVLFVSGLYLHFWTMFTLRNWWKEGRLCTKGPFKYLRHPMYAAWITFITLGLALALNSWVILLWSIILHPIWHHLVIKEEKMAEYVFGDQYRNYFSRRGRFIPRFRPPSDAGTNMSS
jgi:protein-S-isoprenylcysteine O-methyltransferase Ste14